MKDLIIEVKDVNKEIKNTKKYLKYCDQNNCKIKFKGTKDYWLKNIEKAINTKDTFKRYFVVLRYILNILYLFLVYLKCDSPQFFDNLYDTRFRLNLRYPHKIH